MPKRKTNEQFKQEVFELVGDEYIFLDAYVNKRTKLRVKHKRCGYVYKVLPSNFIKGTRCPHCYIAPKQKTNAQFKKEVHDLVGNDYTFLEPYVNNYTKLKVKHNKCGRIYEVKPNVFLQGRRCPYCAKVSRSSKLAKTDAQFKQEIFDLVGDEYTFLDSYVNTRTKLRVKHTKCGNVYEVKPNTFLNGHRCPYCAGLIKKTDTQFKKEVHDLVGDDYTFLDTYINVLTKIRVKHNKCGHIYKVVPSNFLRGQRCPYCAGNAKKTDAQFKQEIFDLVGDEYTFLDHYINTMTKIRVKHNKCGHVYEVRPDDFFNKHSRCPYCANSKGEDIINKILKVLGVKYEYQKIFDDLKDARSLSYDFYIPSQNILIEYQGRQHYHPVDIFGGNEQFKVQQKHDKMKADYAKSHNYNLIDIPYTEDTFSKIKKYLIKHGLKRN